MVSTCASVIGAALLMAADVAINLTPISHQTKIEGGVSPDILFRAGDDEVLYRPPAGWRIAGDATKASLVPDAAEADASIQAVKKPESTAFDPETIKALKAELQASLPKGAERVEWSDDEPNPMLMNRHPTYRITASYSLYGQRFKTTVMYCNFSAEQMRFKITCREADFPKLYEDFRHSFFTFLGLK